MEPRLVGLGGSISLLFGDNWFPGIISIIGMIIVVMCRIKELNALKRKTE